MPGPRLGPSWLRRCLAKVGREVIAFGQLWVHIPQTGAPPTGASSEPGTGALCRHPERLRPDIPLTCAERAWERELRGLGRERA